MSTIVADFKVYNYVYNGIRKIAFNDTGNEFYVNCIRTHFATGDFSNEMKRLVQNWFRLNERSYDENYKHIPDHKAGETLVDFMHWGSTKKEMTAIQLHKFLYCITYNIDNSLPDLSEQDKKDIDLLELFKSQLQESIVKCLCEWDESDYSEFGDGSKQKTVRPLYYYQRR